MNFERYVWTERNELDKRKKEKKRSTVKLKGCGHQDGGDPCVCTWLKGAQAGLTGHGAEVEVLPDDLLELAVH